MRYYGIQSFEGLSIQNLKRQDNDEHKFFVGGSSAGRVAYQQHKTYLNIYNLTQQLPAVSFISNVDMNKFLSSTDEKLLSVSPLSSLLYEKGLTMSDLPDRYKIKKKKTDYLRATHANYFVNGNEFKISCCYKKTFSPVEKVMSSHTKAKIKNKFQAFYYLASSRKELLKFITLTFVGKVSDEQAKKTLNSFLTQIRKKYADFHYLWIAEKQDNGNIHYHLTTNKFLDVRRYNLLWVQCQFNQGVSFHGISKWSLYRKAVEKGKIKGLNPYDVKVIKDISSCASYITKYITKNKSALTTSLWHCSRSVSILGISTFINQQELSQHFRPEVNYTVNKNTGELFDVEKKYVNDLGQTKYCYRYQSDYFYYVKTLNKKRLHSIIKDYINNVNRKLFDVFERITDIRHEIELTKKLSRKRCQLIDEQTATDYITKLKYEILYHKNKLYKLIPLIKTWDLYESPGYSWN